MDEHFEEVKELLDPILDCFGGADGGVSFIALRGLLAEASKKAEEGHLESQQILLVAQRFSRLVEIVIKK